MKEKERVKEDCFDLIFTKEIRRCMSEDWECIEGTETELVTN